MKYNVELSGGVCMPSSLSVLLVFASLLRLFMKDETDKEAEIYLNHLLDEDGLCWCEPEALEQEDGQIIWVHRDEN